MSVNRTQQREPAVTNSLPGLLRRHRSIRRFLPEPIAPDLVRAVCDDAIKGASSYGNLNAISIILTRDEIRKRKLFEQHRWQEMVNQAPLVVTICADWHRTREWLRMRGARDNFNNFFGFLVGAIDAGITAQNVALGFEARGLGICYLGTTLSSMRGIAELLELPDTCVPVTSLVVGHPDEDPPERDRLPLEALVHEEVYRKPDAGSLAAIYAERERRGWERYLAVPRLRSAIENLGITSLAEFYTSKAKYDPEAFAANSRELMQTLMERHLMP